MARDTLTGSRIRERRIMAGIKQADLAREANISASYLNLIEHNRRRIGGKVLLDIAAALAVEPSSLTEGAEATLLATLREAAAGRDFPKEDLARIEEFAGRFPGWAALLAESRRRIDALERNVETLADRLTHDPYLAASMHEMLSTVTAIRSAASILVEPGDIEPEWQKRFNRNIYEDSARLAETSQRLVKYLDAADSTTAEMNSPQDELDGLLEQCGYLFPQLEGPKADVEEVLAKLGGGLSSAAKWLFRSTLKRYARDAATLPLHVCEEALAQHGLDPLALAQAGGVDAATAMRRLAHLPETIVREPVGLAICDGSGVLIYRKPLPDFPLPRLGAGCALWPLYRALSRPMMVHAEIVEQPARTTTRHLAIATAQPVTMPKLRQEAIFESQMVILPSGTTSQTDSPLLVGMNCRICPRQACEARREQSILDKMTE